MVVLIANVIAIPIAWYFINKWLDDFVYRTALSWWVFAIAALGAVLMIKRKKH